MGNAGSEEGGDFSLQSGKSSQASEGESRELSWMSKRSQLCQELEEEHCRQREQQVQSPQDGNEFATKTVSLCLAKGEFPLFKFMLL